MKVKGMTKLESKDYYEKLKITNFNPSIELDKDYLRIREKLVLSYNEITSKTDREYIIDLFFGVSLYSILEDELELSKNFNISSRHDNWRYINMMVIPDILFRRWNDSKDRFYDLDRRSYTYTLWWYIHLSWQKEAHTTIELLKNNSTDTIVQLTERVGRGITGGYEVDLYRAIIRELSKYKRNGQLFRRVMVLNTLYVSTLEPIYYEGSYDNYAKMLFEKAKLAKDEKRD